MKKILALIIVANFSFIYSACPSFNPPEFNLGGGTYLDGDSELNAWAAAYGDCPSYTLKSLIIANLNNTTSIENIFSGLTSISGDLSIVNANQLISINDFENLGYIGNELEMINVNNLSSIQGLNENGINVYALGISNANNLSNCSQIPLFNCNMTLLSAFANIGGLDCDYIDVIGCDGSCERVNEYSGPSTDLVLSDCTGNCGGSNYWAFGDFCWNGPDGLMECEENPNICLDQSCVCAVGTSDDGNICPQSCQEDSFALGAASVDITSDNQASYDAGVASVTPEDGITQDTVDAAVEVAAMESYILGAQSGDINDSGFLNVTDIILYVEKILAD